MHSVEFIKNKLTSEKIKLIFCNFSQDGEVIDFPDSAETKLLEKVCISLRPELLNINVNLMGGKGKFMFCFSPSHRDQMNRTKKAMLKVPYILLTFERGIGLYSSAFTSFC